MDSLEVAEEITDQFDDELFGQEAMEFAADWSVSVTPIFDAQQKLWIFNQKLKYFKSPR